METRSCNNCDHKGVCSFRNSLGAHGNVLLEAGCLPVEKDNPKITEDAFNIMFAAQGSICLNWKTQPELKVAD